jgi:pyruvate/2-oxoglutarate/acetoin dehydrogenase E1 component
MRELAYYEAKFEALEEIMAADQRVHLINGTFLSLSPHRHVFQTLKSKYGERMISPPISELGFCGLATGAAMAGLRPIVDLSTGSFIFEAWPQVANEAANAFSMSGGQTRVPVVFHLFHGLRCRLRRAMSKVCSRPPLPPTTQRFSSITPDFWTLAEKFPRTTKRFRSALRM